VICVDGVDKIEVDELLDDALGVGIDEDFAYGFKWCKLLLLL
jgi:hypothetical protein